MQDRCFSDYYPTNTMGKEPIERIILSDATHVEWNYSQQGSFARECSIEGSVLTFKESIFGNKHLRILLRMLQIQDKLHKRYQATSS